MAKLSSIVDPSLTTLGNKNAMTSASQPRAAYCMPSYNTSSTFYGMVFFDSEFNKITYSTGGSYYGSTGQYESYDGTYTTNTIWFGNINVTQSEQSSNSGIYMNGLWNGEYGFIGGMAESRGSYANSFTRWPTTSVQTYGAQNSSFVNSDHKRKDVTVQFRNGIFTRNPLHRPWDGAYGSTVLHVSNRKWKDVSSAFPSGTQVTSMYGSASYNAVRKELVALAYNSNQTGQFDVLIWKNVDWDANDCDVSQLTTSPSNSFSVVTPSWTQTDNESRYNIKVVLVDNGDIYYSIMFQSNVFRLYRITRAAGDGSGTSTALSDLSLTTSYGKDQGDLYGQRAMQTRLGNMVLTSCPYYYYGSGLRSFVIDKRNSNWAQGRQNTGGSAGMNPLKYRDDSFAYVLGGNYYADNYSGIGTMGFTSPSQTSGGAPVTNTNSWYLTHAPGPNTTNYVGLYHVWDYDLLSIPPAYSGKRN